MLSKLFTWTAPSKKHEPLDEWREMQRRTLQRQREASERLRAEGKHVLYGYTPPEDTDLQRTFTAARSQLLKRQGAIA